MKRVTLAEVIVLYKEYPHTDTVERAEELVSLVLKTLRGQVKPVMSLRAGPGLDSAPGDLSGFLPAYAERGALRFCR